MSPARTLAALAAALWLALPAAAAPRTQNVILITLDGVRTQEIFGGLDETIAKHADAQPYSEMAVVRTRYAAATPEARRAALMPTFWKTLAPQGIVFGNHALGSRMEVENAHAISSPGYVELMTGAPRAEVVDNTLVRYPHRTALQAVAEERRLDFAKVAQIGSWDGFSMAASNRDGGFLMNGGFDPMPAELSTPAIDTLAGLRREVMGLWEEGSDDMLSFRIAQDYLRAQQPRLLWIGLGNSDDWSHADRYDRLLTYLHRADGLVGELWATLQSLPQYRDRTTLILTTDHGRGLTGTDWHDHATSIPGCESIWALVIGPDTPATGEARGGAVLHQGQVAATILQYFELGPAVLGKDARPPLPMTLTTETRR